MKRILIQFLLPLCFLASINLSAQITTSVNRGCAPLDVQFFAPSTSTSYFWDLGNAGTSVVQNPERTYGTPGDYTITFRESENGPVIAQVTINVYPKPDLIIDATPQTGCPPLSVQFDENSIIDEDVIINNYIWTFGTGGSTSGTQMPEHTFQNAGDYDISLSVTSNIANCSITEQFLDFIKVEEGPDIGFTTDPNPPVTCESPLTVSFENTSDEGFNYAWDLGNGVTSTDYNPPTQTYDDGIYTVSLTITGGACDVTETKIISVGDPFVDFTFLSDTICVAAPITFINNSVDGDYVWDFGNGLSSTADNPNTEYGVPGTYTVSLTVTTEEGCSNDTTKTIVVQQADATFTSDPSYSCTGFFSTSFTPNDSNAATYSWVFSDFTSSNEFMPSYTTEAFDSATYAINIFQPIVTSLTVLTTAGCSDTEILTDTIWRPNAEFMPDVAQGCAPLEVSFQNLSLSNEDITALDYDFGDGTSETYGDGDEVVHTYTTPGEYDVILTLTNSAECKDTSYAITIEVGEELDLSFSVDKTIACPDETVRFTVDQPIPAEVDAWHFETDGGRSFHCPDQNSLDWTFNTETGFFPTTLVSDYNGCMTVTQQNGAPLVVNGPIAKLNYEMDCTTPFEVTFSDDSYNALNVKWYFGDGDSSILNNPVHVFPDTGDYVVRLVAFNGFTGCPESVDSAVVCIRDLKASFEIDTLLCTGREYMLDASSSEGVDNRCWRGYTWDIPRSNRPITTQEESIPFVFGATGDDIITLVARDINGCLDTATLDIRVFEVVPNFEADDLRICLPGEVNFTDNSVGDTTLLSWDWDFGDNSSINSLFPNMQSHTYEEGGVTTNPIEVALTVKDVLGCEGTSIVGIDVYEPTSTIFAKDKACVGEEIFTQASDFTSEGSSLTFDWNFSNGMTSTNQVNTVVYDTPGNYNIVLNIEEIATGCKNTIERQIEIQAYPIADFSSPTDSLFCSSAAVEFTDSSISSSPIDNYYWDFGGSIVEGSDVTSVSNNFGVGTYDLTLTVSTSAGCSDTKTQSFSVLEPPTGDFDANTFFICKDAEITFELKDTSNVSAYKWDFADGTTADNQSPITHDYEVQGIDSFVVVLTLTQVDGLCEVVVEKPVIVVDVVADFEIVRDDVCDLTLAFVNNSEYADTYSWDFGNGMTSDMETPTITYDEPGVYTISLLSDSGVLGCSDTYEIELIIEPEPEINVTDQLLCFGESTTLIAEGADENGVFLWSPGNFINGSNQVASPMTNNLQSTVDFTLNYVAPNGCQVSDMGTILVSENIEPFNWSISLCGYEDIGSIDLPDPSNGLYQYTWNDDDAEDFNVTPEGDMVYIANVTDGCASDVIFSYEIDIVTPMADFEATPDPFCGRTIFFENLSSDATDYMWEFGNGNTSNERDPSNPYEEGNYTVQLTVSNANVEGCVDVLNAPVEIVQNIAARVPNAFTPNRDNTNDYFDLILDAEIDLDLLVIKSFEVYNRWGKLIYNNETPLTGWDGTYNGKEAPSDVYLYFIEVEYGGACEAIIWRGDVTLLR